MSTIQNVVTSLNRIIFIEPPVPHVTLFFVIASKASEASICGICSEQISNVTGFSLRSSRVCFIHIYLLVTNAI